MINLHGDILWTGSEASWDVVIHAQKMVNEGIKAGRYAANSSGDQFPPIWFKSGNVAVIDMAGSLIDGQAGWMRYFGVLGYDDIAQAAIDAYSDPDVTSVLWHINSGGGQVNGCAEMGKLANQLSGLKPSMTFSSTTMASAAYWNGSSIQGPVHVGQTAEIGSIGVITVHTEYSKMDAMGGVTRTVMRAGENKALANPIEPLSDKARAQVEGQLAYVHDIFIQAVSKNRPALTADELKAATDGSTFLGKQAVTAGLADKVSTYEQALKLLDKPPGNKDTSRNPKGAHMKITLSDTQVAAIQAGASLASLSINAADLNDEQHEMAASAEAAATKLVADAAAAAVAEKDKPTQGEALKPSQDVVALLQSQLATSQASLMATNSELVTLKATTQTQAASHDGLLKIARLAIGKMSVALGGSTAASETLDAAAAITEYDRIAGVFSEKYKPGQVSAGTQVDDKPAEIDPQFLRRTQSAAK